MAEILHKKEFTFHDRVNNVINGEVKIYWINKRWELHIGLEDYELDTDYSKLQQEFIDYCNSFGWTKFVTDDIKEEVISKLDTYIEDILEADEERIEQVSWEEFDTMVEYDNIPDELQGIFNDDKLWALALHLEITPYDAINDISVSSYDDCFYEYGNREYYVYTDDERESEGRERAKDLIESCYLTKEVKESWIYNHFDMNSAIDDVIDDGYNNLFASYDGDEYEENVNDIYYYIYRCN